MVTEYQHKSLQTDLHKAAKIIDEQQTEIERLQKRNAALEAVATAADDVAQYCEIDAAGWMDSLIASLDKLRDVNDAQPEVRSWGG